MKNLHSLSFVLAVAAFAVPALAQERAASAPMPAMAASMPMTSGDCAKSAMKRHDHGAERNTGTSATATTMPCAADGAASSASTSKKKAGHDHAKFHKNQG
jgi:hypothetical protein